MSITYICESCGAVLGDITKPTITCEYCGRNYRNEEMNMHQFMRNDVAWGMSFLANYHKNFKSHIIDFLTRSDAVPLDVLTKAKIISIQPTNIPAYYFDYTCQTKCSYSMAVKSEAKVPDGNGGETTVTNTAWLPTIIQSDASIQKILVDTRKYEYKEVAQRLYTSCSQEDFVDLNHPNVQCSIPTNTEIIDFSPNIPNFTKLFHDDIMEALKKSTQNVLRSFPNETKNLHISPNFSVVNGMEKKTFLAVYKITISYDDDEYVFYSSNTGENWIDPSKSPVDTERFKRLKELKAIKQKDRIRIISVIISILFAICDACFAIVSFQPSNYKPILWEFIALILLVFIAFILLKTRTKVKYNNELDNFHTERLNMISTFKENNGQLNGEPPTI